MNRKRAAALRGVLQGRHAHRLAESRIENTLRGEAAPAGKLFHRASAALQQLLGVIHTVGINQLLEVAAEVRVHRVAQVGRIRAGYGKSVFCLFTKDCIAALFADKNMVVLRHSK